MIALRQFQMKSTKTVVVKKTHTQKNNFILSSKYSGRQIMQCVHAHRQKTHTHTFNLQLYIYSKEKTLQI